MARYSRECISSPPRCRHLFWGGVGVRFEWCRRWAALACRKGCRCRWFPDRFSSAGQPFARFLGREGKVDTGAYPSIFTHVDRSYRV